MIGKSRDLKNKNNSSMSNLDEGNKEKEKEKEKEKKVLPQLNVLIEISIANSVKILKILSTIILMKNQANFGKKIALIHLTSIAIALTVIDFIFKSVLFANFVCLVQL